MKRRKKIVSVLLTAMMVLAMAAPGFADVTDPGTGDPQPPAPVTSEGKTGSITIDNPQQVLEEGSEEAKPATYTAYRIFDVTYSGTSYAYSIAGTSEWFSAVKEYAEKENSGLSLAASTAASSSGEGDKTIYNVVTTNEFSAPAFAAHLKANLSGKTGGKQLTADGEGVSVSELPLGYYFVSTDSGALCNLTTTNPEVTIHDKNDHTFTKTDNEAEDVEIGEVVNYTITGKVPDTTGFSSYTYKVEDTLSKGLSFVKAQGGEDVAITVTLKGAGEDGEDVVLEKGTAVADGKYTLTTTGATEGTPAEGGNPAVLATGGKFTLQIDVMNLKQYIGADIEVTYQAVVNENAVATVEGNKAVLNYSHDPQNPTDTTPVNAPEEKVYTSRIVVDKFAGVYNADGTLDESQNSAKLAGATFVLYRETTEGEGEGATTKTEYYKFDTEADKVTWVEGQANGDTFVTDEDGAVEIPGLKDGIYYLKETVAPTGYNLLTEAVKMEINGEDALEAETTEEQTTALTNTALVPNNTGAELPGTGGIGTTIFYAAGILLMAGAVFFVIRRRRA